MPKVDLEVVFKITEQLPRLPRATLRALELLDDPEYSVSELAHVIGLDQALAGRVLRWANSPFYGLRYEVSTLEQAIMVLGMSALRDLLMTASVNEMLDRKMPGYNLERGALWRHSVAVAAGSRWLATAQGYASPSQAFTAGLLHDIGKLVLDEVLRRETTWQAEWSELRSQGASFTELERWLIGLDHAELGRQIAERWNLPLILQEAIACHHDPERATVNPSLVRWVHLADAAALMLGIGLGYDGLSYELSEETFPTPDFQTADFEALMEFESAAVRDAESIFQHPTHS